MHFPFVRATYLTRKIAFLLLCLAACSAPFSGCSKPNEKEPKEEKKVVHDLNIQTSDDSATPNVEAEKATVDPADEVESLPFESGKSADQTPADEELPVLGGGS